MSNFDEYQELEQKKKELMNELKNSKKGCYGCLITIIVILIIIIGIGVYVSHLPAFRPLVTCMENQTELYNAITRYKDLNGTFPKTLNDISDEYLNDKNILYCPTDTDHKGYEYRNPDEYINPPAFIIRCKGHKLNENQPFPPIIISKDGKITYDIEEFEKMSKQ